MTEGNDGMARMRKASTGAAAADGGRVAPGVRLPEGMTLFDEIYEQPDPRAYFRVLGSLGYHTVPIQ
jgi:hypothetical protein